MKELLTFRALGTYFALDADAVVELTEFPALSGWPGAPHGVLGVVDYRGTVIAVVDISRKLGGPPQQPSAGHQLLVIETGGARLGLLIESADELGSYPEISEGEDSVPEMFVKAKRYLAGLRRVDGRVVLVLNSVSLVDSLDGDPLEVSESAPSSETDPILLERAEALARPLDRSDSSNLTQLVVVRLGGERMGIEIQRVGGLTPCPELTPVPGTPEHFLGLGYFRGELMRVLDIRAACGLEAGEVEFSQVVILTGPGMTTGIAVEAIDAVASVEQQRSKALYQDGWLTILNLDELPLSETAGVD